MSTALAVLILAQGSQHTQEAPDSGVGIGLIIGAVLLVALVAVGIFLVFTRTTRASRGGVVRPKDERPPGQIDPVLAEREPPARRPGR